VNATGTPALRPSLLVGLWRRFRDAGLSVNAAAVAYNAFLAIVPLAIAMLGAAAFLGESDEALATVEESLSALAPEAVTRFIMDLLEESGDRIGRSGGWVITVSILVAIAIGSRAVAALQKALAAVENRTERRPGLQLRAVAVGLTLAGGAALLLTSFLLVGGRRLIEFLVEITGIDVLETVWVWLRIPVSALGLFAFLLALYHWGPPQPLPRASLAAFVATAGAVLASLAFGVYLRVSPELGATIGVLGTVAIALIWLYVGTFMILLGAVLVAYLLRWQVGDVIHHEARLSPEDVAAVALEAARSRLHDGGEVAS
jgi:membrane protein